MSKPTVLRLLALTGPVFAILFVVVAFGLEGEGVAEKAGAQEVIDYYSARQGRAVTDALLGPLGATLIVLFFSHLRTLARERTITPGPGPTIMISGATILAAGLLLGSTLTLALASAADNDLGQAAQSLNVLSSVSWIPFIGGIAVTLVGAGMTVLSSGFLPKWMGWVAIVAGVASLAGPGGFLGFFLFPLWMLVGGILLARTSAVTEQTRSWPNVERRQEPAHH